MTDPDPSEFNVPPPGDEPVTHDASGDVADVDGDADVAQPPAHDLVVPDDRGDVADRDEDHDRHDDRDDDLDDDHDDDHGDMAVLEADVEPEASLLEAPPYDEAHFDADADDAPPVRPRSSRRIPREHVAGVRFRRAGKVYWFDASACLQAGVGEQTVVETMRGREIGTVIIAPGQVQDANFGDLTPIIRIATAADRAGQAALRLREPEALMEARVQIRRQDLPMKAVLAEYNYDGSRLTIYFTSDEMRVDFRNLVRDLARSLRTRVTLRQIGPRDQAKLVGGIDRCGRELCCTSWMPEFQPISIRMAKNQGLPLNPSEISGVCGKLLCCLAFEDDQYREMRKGLPKVGAKLTSAVGKGKVIDVNVITRKITIIWETGSRVEVDAEAFAEQQDRLMKAFGGGEVPPEFLPPDARPTVPAAPAEHGPRRFYMQRDDEHAGESRGGTNARGDAPPSTDPSPARPARDVARLPERTERAPAPRPRPRGERTTNPPPPGVGDPARPRRQRRRRRGGGGGGAPGGAAAMG